MFSELQLRAHEAARVLNDLERPTDGASGFAQLLGEPSERDAITEEEIDVAGEAMREVRAAQREAARERAAHS